MKVELMSLLAAVYLFSGTAAAETEWVHRTLMGNTLPAAKCEVKADAEKAVTKPSNIQDYAKRFCGTQGYGWSLEQVKNEGKLVCESCGTNNAGVPQQKCHVEDVVAECRRIKPGSVGMLPGKG